MTLRPVPGALGRRRLPAVVSCTLRCGATRQRTPASMLCRRVPVVHSSTWWCTHASPEMPLHRVACARGAADRQEAAGPPLAGVVRGGDAARRALMALRTAA